MLRIARDEHISFRLCLFHDAPDLMSIPNSSSKPTGTTLDLIRSLVELEMAGSTKRVIQLPQVNKIYVNFESLEHQVGNLKLETRLEKREDENIKELQKPKKTSHHRLPLNHVFHQEMKFFFKIDVSYSYLMKTKISC